ncbi:MAG: hypothetical protein ABIG28_02525 [archaeon]
MYPRWHFILGIVFAALIWIVAPGTNPLYLFLVFFGAFFIDFDHYLSSVIKTKKYGLKNSLEYHKKYMHNEAKEIKKGTRKKGDFHVFHTVEFHILTGLLGLFWIGFFYIFIGMVFHSLLDIFDFIKRGVFHRREFFFFNWQGKRSIRKN